MFVPSFIKLVKGNFIDSDEATYPTVYRHIYLEKFASMCFDGPMASLSLRPSPHISSTNLLFLAHDRFIDIGVTLVYIYMIAALRTRFTNYLYPSLPSISVVIP